MVEFAIATGVLLLLVLGLTQLALVALANEGAQADVLEGARIASAAVPQAMPLAALQAGSSELDRLLPMALFGSRLAACLACGLPEYCTRYRGAVSLPHSLRPCGPAALPGGGAAGWGPAPIELDGSQNPGCAGGACFGVGGAMAGCRHPPPTGVVDVCLTYANWPATAVDVWVRGSLDPIVPVPLGAVGTRLAINARLRLQVEQLAA